MKRKNACASFSDEGYLLGFRFREMVPDNADDATFDLLCFAVGQQTSVRKPLLLATADDMEFETSFLGQVMGRGIWLHYMSAIR